MHLGSGGQRYLVESHLGDGATGRVLGCRSVPSKDFVAVKVAKATNRQWRHAEAESEVLKALARHDPDRATRLVVRLLDTFVQDEVHFCQVFEPLALSLRGLMLGAGPKHRGLLMTDIRDVTRRLLEGLRFMHSAGFAHTDLKCTNVMLRDSAFELEAHPRADPGSGEVVARPSRRPCEAVLIDFGMAMVPPKGSLGTGPREGFRVGARHLRAPEVVLGMEWTVVIDLWSLGTLLYSLYTGDRLFRVHEDVEHLATMERICEGRIPAELARGVSPRIAAKGVSFEESTLRLVWPEEEVAEGILEQPTLRETVLPRHGPFLELLQGLLELRPDRRLTAEAALKDAFVAGTAELVE